MTVLELVNMLNEQAVDVNVLIKVSGINTNGNDTPEVTNVSTVGDAVILYF